MYYLYRHIRLDKNMPFYIGIGTICKRGFINPSEKYARAKDKIKRNIYWKRIVNKTEHDIEIIYESDDRNEIVKKEIEFIKLYGRISEGGMLANLSSGGEGPFGIKRSKEERNKMSESRKGKNNINYGKKFSANHCKKISSSNKGKKHTDITIKLLEQRKFKPIKCIELGLIFNNAGLASKSIFKTKNRYFRVKIAECCRKQLKFKNYTFRWHVE